MEVLVPASYGDLAHPPRCSPGLPFIRLLYVSKAVTLSYDADILKLLCARVTLALRMVMERNPRREPHFGRIECRICPAGECLVTSLATHPSARIVRIGTGWRSEPS